MAILSCVGRDKKDVDTWEKWATVSSRRCGSQAKPGGEGVLKVTERNSIAIVTGVVNRVFSSKIALIVSFSSVRGSILKVPYFNNDHISSTCNVVEVPQKSHVSL